MKVVAWTVMVGMWVGGVVTAEERRGWIPRGFAGPVYHLKVTPLDWKFASRTRMSSGMVENQVGLRLLEGLGWGPRFGGSPRGRARPVEANVRIELAVKELNALKGNKGRRIAYSFRVVVKTPKDWPPVALRRGELPAWQWEKGGEGVSKARDYPHDFRQDLNRVLDALIKDWKARFEQEAPGSVPLPHKP